MKLITITAAFSCLVSLSAFASSCFVVNTCVREATSCRLMGKAPTYSSFSETVNRVAQHSYEWVQTIECSHRHGRVTQHFKDGVELVRVSGFEKVKELRIPESIDEVPSSYLEKANQAALDNCNEQRLNLIESYKVCK